jgi:hypothetical protein
VINTITACRHRAMQRRVTCKLRLTRLRQVETDECGRAARSSSCATATPWRNMPGRARRGAAAVIIYSDPKDDGYYRGDAYPKGPWRPASGTQRGSVGYMFQFPGDPTTPGVASLPSLPDSKRVPPNESAQLSKIPVTPLSYADASPILEHLARPASPREWQGARVTIISQTRRR